MLSIECKKYLARAVVQYVNGDFEEFKKYKDIAMHIYEKEISIATIGEIIPIQIRKKLYEMVS